MSVGARVCVCVCCVCVFVCEFVAPVCVVCVSVILLCVL